MDKNKEPKKSFYSSLNMKSSLPKFIIEMVSDWQQNVQ